MRADMVCSSCYGLAGSRRARARPKCPRWPVGRLHPATMVLTVCTRSSRRAPLSACQRARRQAFARLLPVQQRGSCAAPQQMPASSGSARPHACLAWDVARRVAELRPRSDGCWPRPRTVRKVFKHHLVVGRIADIHPALQLGVQVAPEQFVHDPACACQLVVLPYQPLMWDVAHGGQVRAGWPAWFAPRRRWPQGQNG